MQDEKDWNISLEAELIFLRKIDNHRLRGLYIHLLIDGFVNAIIEKHFQHPKTLLEKINYLNTKVLILYSLGLLSQKLFHNLKIINQIRNKYAHNLWVEESEIEEILKRIIFSESLTISPSINDIDVIKRNLMELAFKEIGEELIKILKR